MIKLAGGVVALVLVAVGGYFVGNAAGDDAEDSAGDGGTGSSEECKVAEYAMGLRFQQQSAEAQALQRQAYSLATKRLDEIVKKQPKDADLAVVTDLDETAIDNTALLARDLAKCHDYSTWDTWKHWEREGDPTLIPGAKEFFDHADELGVSVYYVSDRYQENKQATIDTLTGMDLPQVDSDHVLLLGPPKEKRRAKISGDHKIVMLLGDTLADFDGAFDEADVPEQRKLVEENADQFGAEWIVFPNPTYGDWSEAELEEWDAPMEIEE